MAHESEKSVSIAETEKLSLESSSAHEPLLDEKHDLEAQTIEPAPQDTHPEDEVSTRRKLVFLGLYFIFNLGVVLSNKAVLSVVSRTCHIAPEMAQLNSRRYHYHGY